MTDDLSKISISEELDAPQGSIGDTYSVHNKIKMNRTETISTADDEINITEPSSASHPVYPYNNSEQTMSGHVRELDDTPGAERIFEMHKSGTFYEIHPDGTRVLRVYGDNFEIALSDNNLVVGGNLNITVQGDANILTKGNVKQKVGGNYELTVHGNMQTRVRGTRMDYTKGDTTIQTNSNMEIRTEGTRLDYTKGNMTVQTKSTFERRVDGDTLEYTKGTVDMQSGDDMFVRSEAMFQVYSQDLLSCKTNADMYWEARDQILGAASAFAIDSSGDFSCHSSGTIKIISDQNVWIDGAQVRLGESGDGTTPVDINIDEIEDKDPEDKDPTGGLTVEKSVTYPSSDIIKTLSLNDHGVLSLLDGDDTTYPKDRTKID